MLTDYHVHLERGPLTLDWLGLFIAEADRQGITDFGISEHGHRFHEMRPIMEHIAHGPEAWPVYTQWLSHHFGDSVHAYIDLMRKGSDLFERSLKVGLEIDYFPELEGQISDILNGLELDYVLGSVHFIGQWGFDFAPEIGWPGLDIDVVYADYFRLVNRMVLSGAFDIMAHPDVIKIFGYRPSTPLHDYYEEVAANLAKMGMCAELSTAGLRKPVGEIYPTADFLKALRAHDVPIALSSDAHEPGDVGYCYDAALAHARLCGYTESAVFRGRKYELMPLG